MDGFESIEAVAVIAATNRPEILDEALLRPGRFDRQVSVHAPDRVGRRKILEVHTRSIPLADSVDLDVRKISIIPRGMALGVTLAAPDDDQVSYTVGALLAKLKVAVGGRVAEEIIYGTVTTGQNRTFSR
jgi:ATP-dependent Zn protease